MAILPTTLKDINVPKVFIGESVLSLVSQEKYLGYIVNSTGCDNESIRKEMRAVYARGNLLLRHFRSCSEEVKKRLFMSYCSSFYCSSLWANYSNSVLRALHVAHNNVFRSFCGLPIRGSVSLNFVRRTVPNFPVIRRRLVCSMYRRTLYSQNALIFTLVHSGYFTTSRIYIEWTRICF